jgi:hypothetical protein
MADGPSSAPPLATALLAFSAALACAGTGTPAGDSADEGAARTRQHSLLEATTPGAAAAHAENPDPAPAAAPAPTAPAADSNRPGRLLIYSAVTGHVPLQEKPTRDSSSRYRSPAEREAARAREIEAEIQEEMQRQESLDVREQARTVSAHGQVAAASDPGSSPLTAPETPQLRSLPPSLFQSQEVTIPPGRWQNGSELHLVMQSLDVDGDGNSEEIRYVDPASGAVVRSEHDLDFDGKLDAWVTYENGEPVVRALDADGDGRSDGWEQYSGGRMTARTLDTDGDGVKDTFYRYRGEDLMEKLRDSNNDGEMDRVEAFGNRRRVRTLEDRSLNGRIDTWTTYAVIEGREVVAGVERDSKGNGKPDVFETYETVNGETQLARRAEDVDGNGSIDVVSTYENGRLVQRAISDEALSPL